VIGEEPSQIDEVFVLRLWREERQKRRSGDQMAVQVSHVNADPPLFRRRT